MPILVSILFLLLLYLVCNAKISLVPPWHKESRNTETDCNWNKRNTQFSGVEAEGLENDRVCFKVAKEDAVKKAGKYQFNDEIRCIQDCSHILSDKRRISEVSIESSFLLD